MSKSKIATGKTVKRSLDFPKDLNEAIMKIAEKTDRSFTWTVNNQLRKSLEIDCKKCKELAGDK